MRIATDPEYDRALRIAAAKKDTTPTAIVRELIAEYLQQDQTRRN